MTTGYNKSADALIDALGAIAATEVNAKVNPIIADGIDPKRYVAIRTVRKSPIPIDQVPSLALPVLSIFVTHEDAIRMGPVFHDTIVTIGFEWFGVGTPPIDLDARWTVARAVWTQLMLAVRKGNHDSGSGPVDVLTPAGVVRHMLETPEAVDYSLLASDTLVYPHFLGKMALQQRVSQPDTSALPAFSTLGLWLDKFNADGTEAYHHLVGIQKSM